MLTFFHQISRGRTAWLSLMACALLLEGCALFFQHVMGLSPCVMCIYERVATVGIVLAGCIGAIAPNSTPIRWLGIISWGISAGWGLKLALEHIRYQFPDPNVLFGATCDLFVSFPSWAPLNKWLPFVFEASGNCSDVVWQFLSLSMPQWLAIIFAGMLIVLLLVIIAQFITPTTTGINKAYSRNNF